MRRLREVILDTKFEDFFDAQDLQPGCDCSAQLLAEAATDALLAIRTDLYATRERCQKEVLTAKRAGMPVVILDALAQGEERGSFLMDHMPRIPLLGAIDGDAILRAPRPARRRVPQARALATANRNSPPARAQTWRSGGHHTRPSP